MQTTPVESVFTLFDSIANVLQEELSITYLEALAEAGENVFHKSILQEEISELSKKRITNLLNEAKLDDFTKEDIRRSFQLAILKGMKEHVQPNHQMTPDTVAMFLGYLIEKFTAKQKEISILDPAVGTGNLLTACLNQLKNKEIQGIGSDVDDLLIKLAYTNANLQEHQVQFFNQDSLEPLFVDPVDIVVSDLPVGYYPNDVRAANYELKADKGHSFAHHLFIEQSINHAKDGAYLFFIIPNHLFESEEAEKLNQFVKEKTHIQGLIQLPLTMFKSEKAAKSIFILQKKQVGLSQPKQALFVHLPKLSNQKAVADILQQIDIWFGENK